MNVPTLSGFSVKLINCTRCLTNLLILLIREVTLDNTDPITRRADTALCVQREISYWKSRVYTVIFIKRHERVDNAPGIPVWKFVSTSRPLISRDRWDPPGDEIARLFLALVSPPRATTFLIAGIKYVSGAQEGWAAGLNVNICSPRSYASSFAPHLPSRQTLKLPRQSIFQLIVKLISLTQFFGPIARTTLTLQ